MYSLHFYHPLKLVVQHWRWFFLLKKWVFWRHRRVHKIFKGMNLDSNIHCLFKICKIKTKKTVTATSTAIKPCIAICNRFSTWNAYLACVRSFLSTTHGIDEIIIIMKSKTISLLCNDDATIQFPIISPKNCDEKNSHGRKIYNQVTDTCMDANYAQLLRSFFFIFFFLRCKWSVGTLPIT